MTQSAQPEAPIFELETVGIKARGKPQPDGRFLVLAGSRARAKVVDSYEKYVSSGYQAKRQLLLSDGTLQPDPNSSELVFTRDTECQGSTEAACVVSGSSLDGTQSWFLRLPDGSKQSHGQWLQERKQFESVEVTQKAEGPQFTWKPFFRELASVLLSYEQRQPELIQILMDTGIHINHDEGEVLQVIDPFTFFSLILKHNSDTSALNYFAKVGQLLGLTAPVPTDLNGVPWANPMNAWFFPYRSRRQPDDIPTLWALARQAVTGEVQPQTFERALSIHKVAMSKLTQGLFWLNPERFLPLNGIISPYLQARGLQQAGQVQTFADYQEVLKSAAAFNPDFAELSREAWAMSTTATLDGNQFPFARFQADVQSFAGDKVKGNQILDNRYAPLLIELMSGDWSALKPDRSPYTGGQQLTVKVSLSNNQLYEKGGTARALLLAGDIQTSKYISSPYGLSLEARMPDEKGDDSVRYALQSPELWKKFLDALNAPLPEGLEAAFVLSTDFGTRERYPLGDAHLEQTRQILDKYRNGFGLSRQLLVSVSLLPHHLESDAFLELLNATLEYLNQLVSVIIELLNFTPPVESTTTIEVTGREGQEAEQKSFVPIPGVPLNQILYGPPGTGKTYRVVDEALAVLDPAFLTAHSGSAGRAARKARYDELIKDKKISFVTFHQSFGYEDFIEGLKPEMKDGQITYKQEDGIFLQAVKAAGGLTEETKTVVPQPSEPASPVAPNAQVWRIYIDKAAPISQLRDRIIENGEIRLDSNSNPPKDLSLLNVEELSGRQILFKDSMRVGDLVLLATSTDQIGAVGVVAGEYQFDPYSSPLFATDYVHSRKVKWLATGLKHSATSLIGHPFSPATLQRLTDTTPEKILSALQLTPPHKELVTTQPALQPHVLIIDEINRGNISKIFGELITLLESSKRAGAADELSVTLPLSRRPLSVPQSLYVIGTMNTADRSLTLLDAALRRRFVFHPVWPEPTVLPVLTLDGQALDLRKFLFAINSRIEHLLSREQMIGHAYLMGIPANLKGVSGALRERILPLLEEYFFEDWGKIREVLGDDHKPANAQFIRQYGSAKTVRYQMNPEAFETLEAFTGVYANIEDKDFPFES